MNPAEPQQPQVDSQDLQKLEEDLKNLEKETTSSGQSSSAPTPQSVPAASEVPTQNVSTVSTESVTPAEFAPQQPSTPTVQTRKNSPLMLIAIILMVLAILAAIAYAIGVQFLGQKSVQNNVSTATVIPSPTDIPTPTPDPTADWETFSQDKFSVKLPTTWKSSQSANSGEVSWDFSSGLPGRVEFIVAKLNTNIDKVKNDVSSALPQGQITTKTINLGNAVGTEYFGCFGVEGCMDQYIVVTSFGGSTYKIDFTPYPDQEVNLYQNIISNFKFTDVMSSTSPSPRSSPSAMPAGY